MSRIAIPRALQREIRADFWRFGRPGRWQPDIRPGASVICFSIRRNDHFGSDECIAAWSSDQPIDLVAVASASIVGRACARSARTAEPPCLWVDDGQLRFGSSAWAPVGGVDGGPRPDIGDRVLALESPDGGTGKVGTVGMVDNITGRIGVDLAGGGSALATEWALLPQLTPGEASRRDRPHDDVDMYELAIRIPMAAFTGAPNADPRLDRLVDLAMGLFPGADATGAPAWLEDGPPPCPTCGATDRAERRHRAHADAEAALRELVRWLTAERDRLDGYDRRAYAYSVVLDHLRGQGLDVDHLAQPAAKETPDA